MSDDKFPERWNSSGQAEEKLSGILGPVEGTGLGYGSLEELGYLPSVECLRKKLYRKVETEQI